MKEERARQLNKDQYTSGSVVYWMQREHRAEDNWALLFALELARQYKTTCSVIFCIRPEFDDATERLIHFMFEGLKEVEATLRETYIPFRIVFGDPVKKIPEYIKQEKVGALVTDFHSLRTERKWREKIAEAIDIPMYEVDSRNIVPCWLVSSKQEFAAYTMRPKIHRLLPEYLDAFPALESQDPVTVDLPSTIDWDAAYKTMKFDTSIPKVTWLTPGSKAAHKRLRTFIADQLPDYAENRNDPTQQVTSHLSTYLHFGHISSQRIVKEVMKHKNDTKSEESFIEEITVRREIADNYCYYNQNYDSPRGFPIWAQKTLEEHLDDPREHVYSLKELEEADTHDDLWNAAMNQAKKTGIMHGWLRMYWAKKIFEWSNNPNTAMRHAITIMDRYFLDGREANGFTGIAWSMGGVHDRAWFTRDIFGKVRYMSYNGAKSKFSIPEYIKMVNEL